MNHTIPLASVEYENSFFHIYVTRPENQLLACQVKAIIPNDYTGTCLEALFPAFEEIIYESKFSTDYYHELRVVDATVELVFGQIISSPSVVGTGTAFNGNWVFYSPNLLRIIDSIRPETGNTYHTNRTFQQERHRYPDLQILPRAVAEDLIFDNILF